jgi:methionyl-tRNA formyltransferase
MNGEVFLLAKQCRFSGQAADVARILFGDRVRIFTGVVGDPLPQEIASGSPEVLLSFLSPWIVPQAVLDASRTALNFHPGSTDYPGIGCYNFALYEEVPEFGAVCHHMLAKVDTGIVVEERLFPVLPTDTVETLKYRTMVTMLAMFHDLCSLLAGGRELPVSPRQWSRRPFTRREMEELKQIHADMGPEEIKRRLRATIYPGYPGPYVTVGAEKFYASVPDRPPLA